MPLASVVVHMFGRKKITETTVMRTTLIWLPVARTAILAAAPIVAGSLCAVPLYRVVKEDMLRKGFM